MHAQFFNKTVQGVAYSKGWSVLNIYEIVRKLCGRLLDEGDRNDANGGRLIHRIISLSFLQLLFGLHDAQIFEIQRL